MEQTITTTGHSVLVIGADTGVGLATAKLLKRTGYNVTAVVNSSVAAAQARAQGILPAYIDDLTRSGEIRSALKAANATLLVNLANQGGNQAPQFNAKWIDSFEAQAKAVAEGAADAGIDYIVHGSVAFADARDEEIAALTRSARRAEKIILNGSVPATVLRFGFIYGANAPEAFTYKTNLHRGAFSYGGPDLGHGAWVYEADAANAVLLALEKRLENERLDIVDQNNASTNAFMRQFAEIQGYGLPDKLPSLIARNVIDKGALRLMELDVHADASAAQEKLGWTPQYSSFTQGIDDMLLTWRARLPIEA